MVQTSKENSFKAAEVGRLQAKQLTQVVAILFYGRSGSYFLQSLLDGHPNFVSLPPYLPQGFYHFWKEYGHLKASDLVGSFADHYAVLFDACNQCQSPTNDPDVGYLSGLTTMGEDLDQRLGVNRSAFIKSLLSIVGNEKVVSRKLFFQAIHVAYTEALGRTHVDSNPAMLVQFHAPNPARIAQLFEDFPETVFLQSVREPMQTLHSHFKIYYLSGKGNPSVVIRGVLSGGELGFAKNKQHCKAIRLEDLHQAPQETLQRLCRWLNIPWDDVLLKSTFDGKQWWNLKGSPQVSGFSEAITASRNEEYITVFDRFRLKILLVRKYEIWRYPYSKWQKNVLMRILILPLLIFPFKMEILAWQVMKISSWKEFQGFIWQFLKTRKALVLAWLKIFQKIRQEPELL